MLRQKAKELSDDPSFKASLGWYQNWKRRHSVSFCAKTTLAQQLPDDMEEKIVQFHRFIIAAMQRVGYPLSRIINLDEMPMRFKLPSLRSLEFTGSQTVPVKTCGAEKRSFTVALAVAADGTKLPPKVIFKGVRTPRDLVVPNSLRVSFHKKGWMDESGVKEWISQCLPRTRNHEQSLLVWDSFQAHLTDVKAALKQRKIDVAVIPGGLTPVLQPLNKCLNKPFKDSIRRKHLAWMISGPFEYTPSGNKKALTRNLVLQWVNEVWQEIPAEMVMKSFRTCGISNALDGTEDDELYNEEGQEIDNDKDNEFETESKGESDADGE